MSDHFSRKFLVTSINVDGTWTETETINYKYPPIILWCDFISSDNRKSGFNSCKIKRSRSGVLKRHGYMSDIVLIILF